MPQRSTALTASPRACSSGDFSRFATLTILLRIHMAFSDVRSIAQCAEASFSSSLYFMSVWRMNRFRGKSFKWLPVAEPGQVQSESQLQAGAAGAAGMLPYLCWLSMAARSKPAPSFLLVLLTFSAVHVQFESTGLHCTSFPGELLGWLCRLRRGLPGLGSCLLHRNGQESQVKY